MPANVDPIVGNWYENLDGGQKFEVVALDEDNDLIEIQYFDGDVDEISIDAWYEWDVEPIEEPEDWTGPLDDIEPDDLGYTETGITGEEWPAPLRETKVPPKLREEGDYFEEFQDEWEEGSSEEEPWKKDED